MLEEKDIPTHVVLVIAFVMKGNKILLAKRSSTDPQAPGEWSTPGGKIDMELGQEIVENTLKRELLEEVGIVIEDSLIYLGSDAFFRGSGHHVVALIFLAHWKEGEAQPLEDQDEVAWYSIEDLDILNNLPPYLVKRLELLKRYFTNNP